MISRQTLVFILMAQVALTAGMDFAWVCEENTIDMVNDEGIITFATKPTDEDDQQVLAFGLYMERNEEPVSLVALVDRDTRELVGPAMLCINDRVYDARFPFTRNGNAINAILSQLLKFDDEGFNVFYHRKPFTDLGFNGPRRFQPFARMGLGI